MDPYAEFEPLDATALDDAFSRVSDPRQHPRSVDSLQQGGMGRLEPTILPTDPRSIHPAMHHIGVLQYPSNVEFWQGPFKSLADVHLAKPWTDPDTILAYIREDLPLVWPDGTMRGLKNWEGQPSFLFYAATTASVPPGSSDAWVELPEAQGWFLNEELFNEYAASNTPALLAIRKMDDSSRPQQAALAIQRRLHSALATKHHHHLQSPPHQINILALQAPSPYGRIFLCPRSLEHWLQVCEVAGPRQGFQLVEEMVAWDEQPVPFYLEVDWAMQVPEAKDDFGLLCIRVQDDLRNGLQAMFGSEPNLLPPGTSFQAHRPGDLIIQAGHRLVDWAPDGRQAVQVKLSFHILVRPRHNHNGSVVLMQHPVNDGPQLLQKLFAFLPPDLQANHVDTGVYRKHHFMRAIMSIKLMNMTHASAQASLANCQAPIYTGRPTNKEQRIQQRADPLQWISALPCSVPQHYYELPILHVQLQPPLSTSSSTSPHSRQAGSASSIMTFETTEDIQQALRRVRRREGKSEEDGTVAIDSMQHLTTGTRICLRNAHRCAYQPDHVHKSNTVYMWKRNSDGAILLKCWDPECSARFAGETCFLHVPAFDTQAAGMGSSSNSGSRMHIDKEQELQFMDVE